MSITNFIQKIKGFINSEEGRIIAFILIVILTGISSFLLGRMSNSLENKHNTCVTVENPNNNIFIQSNNTKSIKMEAGEVGSVDSVSILNQSGAYVASKRGKRFYPVDCSAATSIVSKNRVYFNTSEEAIQKGYTASPSCE